ncbi:MAG: hypothetical protein HUJ62_00285 [Streptococcus gallolyticus]|nr:hypothetical protein [Streptococcus gallolyticus]
MDLHKSYRELARLKTFEERYEYLNLHGIVADETFGGSRYLNQQLYRSSKWSKIRRDVIIRDEGCDLGILDRPIYDKIIIHHLNPLTIEDLKEQNFEKIFDMDNLVVTSVDTHNAIHYGNDYLLRSSFISREPNDTCPWK